MTRKGLKRYPIFVDAVIATTESVLRRKAAFPDEKARVLGLEIAAELCAQFSRTSLYVPDFSEARLQPRDLEIAAAYAQPGPDGARPFTGERVLQLAAQYSLSDVQVYCILRNQRRQLPAAPRSLAAPELAET